MWQKPRRRALLGTYARIPRLCSQGIPGGQARDQGQAAAVQVSAIAPCVLTMSKDSASTSTVVIAMVVYSLASTSMMIVNKMVMRSAPLPSFFSTIQFAATVLTVEVLGRAPSCTGCPRSDIELRWPRLRPYVQHGVIFVAAIYCNMQALRHTNIETIILFRASTPLIVSVLDRACLGRDWPSLRSLLALSVLAAAAVGYVLSDNAFRMKGFGAYTWVSLYFATISIEMAYAKYIVGAVEFDSMWGPVLHNNLAAIPLMALLGMSSGELSVLAQLPWDGKLIFKLALSCVVAVGIGYSGWNCRRMVSASCFTVLGVGNKLLTVLVNNVIWKQSASPLGNFCLFICLLAAVSYQQAPMRTASSSAIPVSSERFSCSSFGLGALCSAVGALAIFMVAPVGAKPANDGHCPERFLTYGSACQDCGFNNQRIDLERALQIAAMTGRTLVVRNVVCSPHSPCPNMRSLGASTDGVIPTLGGVDAWRRICGKVCDADHILRDPPRGLPGSLGWAVGVDFAPARHFFDGDELAKASGRHFLWTDEFHARHHELLGPTAANNWVVLGGEGGLSEQQKDACVWHVPHLHKGSTHKRVVNQLQLPTSTLKQGAPLVVYAAWLRELAAELGKIAGGSTHPPFGTGASGYACAHVRLGDWASHNGCVENCKFQPKNYATSLRSLVNQRWPKRVMNASSSKRNLFLATKREDVDLLEPALGRAGFRVVTSATLAKRVQQRTFEGLGGPPTEDIMSCVEQLVCAGASVFVGTPGSTWSGYVKEVRAAGGAGRKREKLATGTQLPSFTLSPLKFYGGIWQKNRTRRSIYLKYERTSQKKSIA